MVAVLGLSRTWYGGTLLRFRRRLQMCVEQRHLGIEFGFDHGELDFGLDLDLLMDDIVLRLLLFDLCLVRSRGLVGLCPRLQRQQFWIGRRRRRRQRRMQQLPGSGIERGGIAKEAVGVLVPHDFRHLSGGIVKLTVADQIGFATRHQLLLDVGERHHLRELLRLAAGARTDIDGHVVAGFPAARIDIDPGIAQPHRLLLLAMLADRAVQKREDIAHALRHDARDQLDAHLRGRKYLRHRGSGLVLQRVGVDALGFAWPSKRHRIPVDSRPEPKKKSGTMNEQYLRVRFRCSTFRPYARVDLDLPDPLIECLRVQPILAVFNE